MSRYVIATCRWESPALDTNDTPFPVKRYHIAIAGMFPIDRQVEKYLTRVTKHERQLRVFPSASSYDSAATITTSKRRRLCSKRCSRNGHEQQAKREEAAAPALAKEAGEAHEPSRRRPQWPIEPSQRRTRNTGTHQCFLKPHAAHRQGQWRCRPRQMSQLKLGESRSCRHVCESKRKRA